MFIELMIADGVLHLINVHHIVDVHPVTDVKHNEINTLIKTADGVSVVALQGYDDVRKLIDKLLMIVPHKGVDA